MILLQIQCFGLHIIPGSGSNAEAILAEIAAQNQGHSILVDTSSDLLSVMGSYYSDLTGFVDSADNVVWTTPYFDAFGLGVVITGKHSIKFWFRHTYSYFALQAI